MPQLCCKLSVFQATDEFKPRLLNNKQIHNSYLGSFSNKRSKLSVCKPHYKLLCSNHNYSVKPLVQNHLCANHDMNTCIDLAIILILGCLLLFRKKCVEIARKIVIQTRDTNIVATIAKDTSVVLPATTFSQRHTTKICLLRSA